MENKRLITGIEEKIIRENLNKIQRSDSEPNPTEIETINGAFLGIYQSDSMEETVDLYVYIVQPSQYSKKQLPDTLKDVSSQMDALSGELDIIVKDTLGLDCNLFRVETEGEKGGVYYKTTITRTESGSIEISDPKKNALGHENTN